MKAKFLMTAVLIITALMMSACGGGGESTATDSSDSDSNASSISRIDVVMNDNYYGDTNNNQDDSPTWTAGAGAQVLASVKNNGTLQHNYAIVKAGSELDTNGVYTEAQSDVLFYDVGLLDAGQSDSFRFTAPAEAGEYQIICTVAGHYPSMQGKLIVE